MIEEGSDVKKSPPEDALEEQDVINREADQKETDQPQRADPTRYGDWEKNGRCIDF